MNTLAKILGMLSLLAGVLLSPAHASFEPPSDLKILILKATADGETEPILGIKELGRVEQVNKAWKHAAQQVWQQRAEAIFKFTVLPERIYNMASTTVKLILEGSDPAAVKAPATLPAPENYVTDLFKGVVCFIQGMKLGLQKPDTQLVCAGFSKYKLLVRYAPVIQQETIHKADSFAGGYPGQSDPPLMRFILVAAELFGDVSPLRTYLMKKEAAYLRVTPNDHEQCFVLKIQILTQLAEKGSRHAASTLQTLKAIGL